MKIMRVFCLFIYSSSINSNGTAHAGYCTEENTASDATTTSVKETKVKARFISGQNIYESIECVVFSGLLF